MKSRDTVTETALSSGNRMVYGIGTTFVHCCGAAGEWRARLPKVLESFQNPVLISTGDITKVSAVLISSTVGQDRLYLDSGGYTLWRKQQKMGLDNPEFHKLCDKMKKKFLNMLTVISPQEIFELDNEYFRKDPDLLSPLNYCRQEVFDAVGFYPTPVFKMHQGFKYWKDLCESPLYPKLSIGGFAATKSWGSMTEEIKIMMRYARQHNKKVHLLGCQNVHAFKAIQPSTVDYSIFQYAINLQRAKREHPELTSYADLKSHTVLYALASANTRSFLYDCYKMGDSSEIEEMELHAKQEGISL